MSNTNEWMDAESRVEKAQQLYELGKWAEAAEHLQAAIDVNPHNAAWHFNLALVLDAMEDYEAACEAYRGASDLAPDDPEILNGLGVAMTRIGRYSAALACFERVEKIDWANESSYCNRIVTYAEMDQHDKADLMFYMARLVRDECPRCSFNIGNSLFVRGEFDAAIRCWQEVLRIDGPRSCVNGRIAAAYRAKGELERARRYFEAELAVSPGDADTAADLGQICLELGDVGKAEAMFRVVTRMEPNHLNALFGLGEAALLSNRPVRAEGRFRRVLSIDRHFPGAHAKLGEALLQQGRRGLAIAQFRAEMALSEDSASLRVLAQQLLDSQCSDLAAEAWQRVVADEPDDAAAWHNWAVCCFLGKKLDEGIGHCRRALALRPDYPLAMYNLAMAYQQKGQLARARRYATRAMSLSPEDEHIRDLVGRLEASGPLRKITIRLRKLVHRQRPADAE